MPASRQRPAPPEAPVQSNFSIDLIDELEVRKVVGGTKPISKPTLYQIIVAGRLPRACWSRPDSVPTHGRRLKAQSARCSQLAMGRGLKSIYAVECHEAGVTFERRKAVR